MVKLAAVKKMIRALVVLGLAVSVSFALIWALPGFVDPSPLSSAWAQTAPTPDCDADGDGYILDSNKCKKKNKGFPIDCDDSSSDLTTDCSDPTPDSSSEPTCYVESTEDTAGTVKSTVLNDTFGPYQNGMDLVTCNVGDTIRDNVHPLRFRSVSNGNVAQAIRFVDLTFNNCIDFDPSEDDGCARLPEAFFGESEDSIDFQAKVLGMNVEDIPSGESRSGPFTVDVQGYVERYAIQLMAAPTSPGNFFCWDGFDEISGGNADYGLNIYAWADTDGDGRPNGYTVTTGDAEEDSEDFTTEPPSPPKVLAGEGMKALVCSNVGADGSPCATNKDRNKLCHTLAIVDMHFTAHYIVP